ncbi:unnamed protein product, partial [Prorocentrum cordatum]
MAAHSPTTVAGCLGMGGVVAEAKRLAGRDVAQQAPGGARLPSAGIPGTQTPTTPTTAHGGRPGSVTSERSGTMSPTSAMGASAWGAMGPSSSELTR